MCLVIGNWTRWAEKPMKNTYPQPCTENFRIICWLLHNEYIEYENETRVIKIFREYTSSILFVPPRNLISSWKISHPLCCYKFKIKSSLSKQSIYQFLTKAGKMTVYPFPFLRTPAVVNNLHRILLVFLSRLRGRPSKGFVPTPKPLHG